MKAALQKHIDSFQARDAEGLISLCADEATIEDCAHARLLGAERQRTHQRLGFSQLPPSTAKRSCDELLHTSQARRVRLLV